MRSQLFSLAFITLLVSAGCNDKAPTAPTPTPGISLNGNMTFGSVTVGTTATSALTIGNTGAGDLTVTSVTYPSGFTGTFTAGTIPANGSQVITVPFTPIAAQSYTGTSPSPVTAAARAPWPGREQGSPSRRLRCRASHRDAATTSTCSRRACGVRGRRQSGRFAITGPDGRYQITGVVNGGYTVSATITGYTPVALPVGINGNTTLDFRLDPLTARTQWGPGQYRIPTDLAAGRYYNDPAGGCHFHDCAVRRHAVGCDRRRRCRLEPAVDRDRDRHDAGFTRIKCGVWFTTPRRGLLTSITPGAWIVGAQITPGTYRAANSTQGCYWKRLSNFTGGIDAIIASAIASSAGAQLVAIANTDAGFSATTECGT